jgi:hypothetical protein
MYTRVWLNAIHPRVDAAELLCITVSSGSTRSPLVLLIQFLNVVFWNIPMHWTFRIANVRCVRFVSSVKYYTSLYFNQRHASWLCRLWTWRPSYSLPLAEIYIWSLSLVSIYLSISNLYRVLQPIVALQTSWNAFTTSGLVDRFCTVVLIVIIHMTQQSARVRSTYCTATVTNHIALVYVYVSIQRQSRTYVITS